MAKKRCSFKLCKCKLKLTDMKCKCGLVYCSKHRLPETHQCLWDPKSSKEIDIYKKKNHLMESINFKKIENI